MTALNLSIGCAPTSRRPLMKKCGVPLAWMSSASSWSAFRSARYFPPGLVALGRLGRRAVGAAILGRGGLRLVLAGELGVHLVGLGAGGDRRLGLAELGVDDRGELLDRLRAAQEVTVDERGRG